MNTRTFARWFADCCLALFLTAQAAHAFYDPSLGRWINRDPIGERGGINIYQFVGNDPASYLDPDGADIIPYVPPTGSTGHGDNGASMWNNPPAFPPSLPGEGGCKSKADAGKVRNVHKNWYPCPGCNTKYSCTAGDRCTNIGSFQGKAVMQWKPFEENCTLCPGGG